MFFQIDWTRFLIKIESRFKHTSEMDADMVSSFSKFVNLIFSSKKIDTLVPSIELVLFRPREQRTLKLYISYFDFKAFFAE